MNIFKYILQGIAHELVLFFNFIDFSWFFFVTLGFILILINFKIVHKNLISCFKSLINIIKVPIVLVGILLISGMYILTAFLFNDSISFYFVSITLITLVRDIINFYKDTTSDISMRILLKSSFVLAKGALLLLFIRIVNILDVWNFKCLKYTYVYLLYLLTLMILTFIKKVYIIIDEHRFRCHTKGGTYNRFVLFFLYTYSVIYTKNLDISAKSLLEFYKDERTTSIKSDLKKVKTMSLKQRELMLQDKALKSSLINRN